MPHRWRAQTHTFIEFTMSLHAMPVKRETPIPYNRARQEIVEMLDLTHRSWVQLDTSESTT